MQNASPVLCLPPALDEAVHIYHKLVGEWIFMTNHNVVTSWNKHGTSTTHHGPRFRVYEHLPSPDLHFVLFYDPFHCDGNYRVRAVILSSQYSHLDCIIIFHPAEFLCGVHILFLADTRS